MKGQSGIGGRKGLKAGLQELLLMRGEGTSSAVEENLVIKLTQNKEKKNKKGEEVGQEGAKCSGERKRTQNQKNPSRRGGKFRLAASTDCVHQSKRTKN